MAKLLFRPMKSVSELVGFQCGIEEMDIFIQDGLGETLIANDCDAYIVTTETGIIVGFFALCEDQLTLDDDYKDDMACGLSDTPSPLFVNEDEMAFYNKTIVFPVVDIAYLAVQKECQHDGIGTAIMNKIFELAKKRDPKSWFITVDALFLKHKGYSAIGFYKQFGFQQMYPPTSENTVRLFCTLFHE